jgi:uncharacterized protein YjbJ (UPF0337 family)
MDHDSVQGKGEKLVGNVKEAAGRITGDRELEAEGVNDQAAGHVHDTVGAVKDAGRDALAAAQGALHREER